MPYTENLKGEQGGVTLGVSETSYTATSQKNYLVGFTVINDAMLADIDDNYSDSADLVGLTLPAGLFVAGLISSIELSSGVIRGHFGTHQ